MVEVFLVCQVLHLIMNILDHHSLRTGKGKLYTACQLLGSGLRVGAHQLIFVAWWGSPHHAPTYAPQRLRPVHSFPAQLLLVQLQTPVHCLAPSTSGDSSAAAASSSPMPLLPWAAGRGGSSSTCNRHQTPSQVGGEL